MGQTQLGIGYLVYDGKDTGKPEIFDFAGIPLPEDVYKLVVIDHRPVVMTDWIQ